MAFNVDDLANVLGVTNQYVYNLLWEGRIPGAYRVEGSKRWVIPESVMEDLGYDPDDLRDALGLPVYGD